MQSAPDAAITQPSLALLLVAAAPLIIDVRKSVEILFALPWILPTKRV